MVNLSEDQSQRIVASSDHLRSGPRRSWARIVVVAGLLLFIAHESLEELVGTHESHFFRITVHLLAALLAIVASMWVLLTGPPAVNDYWSTTAARTGTREFEYARWFIILRWIAIMVASVLVMTAIRITHWLPKEAWWPLALCILLLVACNLLFTWTLRRHRTASSVELLVQIGVDLVILTVMLHFSGGIQNPLWVVMIFHVIISGIVLGQRYCYLTATLGSGLFALLGWTEATHHARHYVLQRVEPAITAAGNVPRFESVSYVLSTVLLQAILMFLVAYFVSRLLNRVRQNERHIVMQRLLLERALETVGAGLRVANEHGEERWSNRLWQAWFSPQTTCRGPKETPQPGIARSDWRITEVTPASASHNGGLAPILQLTTARLPARGEQHELVVDLAQDITLQRESQKQLMQAGKLAAVGQLAGQVAHEVNNPIAIMRARIDLILDDHRKEISAKVAEDLEEVSGLCDRVAHVAQGLLTYCRPSTGIRTPIDLCIPVQRAVAIIEQRARERQIQVNNELPDSLPRVVANTNELEQVFVNLLLNGLDAMPNGGQLTISSATSAEVLEVTVRDEGVGIPRELQDRVLEPFFTTKEESSGTGLGLPICVGILRSHGGTLSLRSQSGEGTSAVVTLPALEVARE